MIRPTQARIDLAALRHNIRLVRSRLAASTRILAVVKADCYGHGAFLCVPVMRQEGIDIFGVATVEEGMRLRELGVTERVVVLGPPNPGQFDLYIGHELEPLISTIETAESLAAVAEATGRSIRVHVFVDTGMTRNGCDPADAVVILDHIRTMQKLEAVGFCSHFATSDEIDNDYAARQAAVFELALRRALDAGYEFSDIHLANSGGVFNLPTSHHTLVRPGLALYGYHPTEDLHSASGLVPVLTLRSTVGGVKHVTAGTPVSYGRKYTTKRDTNIVTMPIGYADGVHRSETNRAEVLIRGRRAPMVGAVCMDESMVDIGEMAASVGEEIILLGRSGEEMIDAWELAGAAGTIPWEILTSISSRVPRVAWTPEKSNLPTPEF